MKIKTLSFKERVFAREVYISYLLSNKF